MKIRKAVIPAAGLGTRMLPATKAIPKEMLPVVLKPALQYLVEEAAQAGIESILIITARGKEAIADHFDYSPEIEDALSRKGDPLYAEMRALGEMAEIFFVRQREPKGLGHAIGCAREFVGDEPFAVMLGDDIVHSPGAPCIGQLMDYAARFNGSVVGCKHVSMEDISKYGAVESGPVEERFVRVRSLVEKPAPGEAPSDLAILGRYVLEPQIFEYIDTVKPGKGGEIQITDAIHNMAQDRPVFGLDFLGQRYDTGNKLGYMQACVEYALRDDEIGAAFRAYLKDLL